MLTEPEFAWSELFALLFGAALIAFGIGTLAILMWLALNLVAIP